MRTELPIEVKRLGGGDVPLAQETFRLMADVFEEGGKALSDRYVATLLGRPDFWAMVALGDGVPIGGITAHALPMTRSETKELFIYDWRGAGDHLHLRAAGARLTALPSFPQSTWRPVEEALTVPRTGPVATTDHNRRRASMIRSEIGNARQDRQS